MIYCTFISQENIYWRNVNVMYSLIAPSVPTNVSIVEIASTYVLIIWSPPEFPNGLIRRYIVSLTDSRGDLILNTTSTETSANVTGLNPFTQYGVVVSAETVEVGEATSSITFRTSEESECV